MYNDKTVANCASALAFLSAYSSDASQQTKLFDAFDNTLNLNVSIPIKFGILLNGASAALPNRPALIDNLEGHLKDCMKDLTGIEEVDERFSEDAKDEDDQGSRLHGAFEIVAHVGDVFVRRFCTGVTDEVYQA